MARSILRRRDRGGACDHVRRRTRDTGHPTRRCDLLDVPAARLRQHYPRRRHSGSPGDLLPGPRRHGGRRRPDAYGPLRHRLSARRPEHDGDRATGRQRADRIAALCPRAPGRPVCSPLSPRPGAGRNSARGGGHPHPLWHLGGAPERAGVRRARRRCDVSAGPGRRGRTRQRGARRHGRELPLPEAGGPGAARRVAPRPSSVGHGGRRRRD